MSEVIAARRFHFSAIHSLSGFPEPWCRQHGHRYTVELVGSFNHEEADDLWAEMRPLYEGRDLNDLLTPTTVEVLASHFLREFEEVEGVGQVTVWEDDDRWGRATR